MFVTDQQPAELSEPYLGPRHDSVPFVAAEFAAALIALPSRLGKQGLSQLPLFVCQQLLPLLHPLFDRQSQERIGRGISLGLPVEDC